MTRRKKREEFIQEYLYIEEYHIEMFDDKIEDKKTFEPKRGVEVIDLLGNEENI